MCLQMSLLVAQVLNRIRGCLYRALLLDRSRARELTVDV